MPLRLPGISAAAPAGAHLDYFGGPVVSSVQVAMVLYGSGTYQSFVQQAASPSLSTFYGGVTDSPYLDWLVEYDTSLAPAGGQGGTFQAIGRGTFLGQFAIAPSAANDGSTIDDASVQAELAAQIAAGNLPAPAVDADGNALTLYMVHFPKGKTLTAGGASSCASGGFCAYHGTFVGAGGTHVLYGALPDMSTGSGCEVGCGAGSAFQNQTSVASHELVEAVTDPDVGLAVSFGPPLAWYDTTDNGEIADICNGMQGTVQGGDGVTYTVQQEWSNVAAACIVTRPVDDFSVSVSPASRTVSLGSFASYTVSTAVTLGSAQQVALSVPPLPAGLTATFAPSTVAAGATSVLTLAASASAALQTTTFRIRAVGASANHSAVASATVVAGPGIAPASATVPPRGAVAFAASGGSGSGYVWSLAASPSGGTIDAATGAYRAGPTGSVTDVVQVRDSLGTAASAQVAVTAGVTVAPGPVSVPPRGAQAFTAAGGSGTGFSWSLPSGPSGGTVDAVTGAYRAGPTGSVTDTVRATDSLGNAASVQVAVGAGVAIAPASASTPPRGAQSFAAAGGSGAGYSWSLAAGPSGGSIDPASGAYRAGATGSVIDTVQVTDSLGNTASAPVAVSAGVSIAPGSVAVAPGASQSFAASGGSGTGFSWSLAASPSGGAIAAATGVYRAGPTAGVTDTIRVTDSLGNTATATAAVGTGAPASGSRSGCGCGAGGGDPLALLLLAAGALGRLRRRGPRSGRGGIASP